MDNLLLHFNGKLYISSKMEQFIYKGGCCMMMHIEAFKRRDSLGNIKGLWVISNIPYGEKVWRI